MYKIIKVETYAKHLGPLTFLMLDLGLAFFSACVRACERVFWTEAKAKWDVHDRFNVHEHKTRIWHIVNHSKFSTAHRSIFVFAPHLGFCAVSLLLFISFTHFLCVCSSSCSSHHLLLPLPMLQYHYRFFIPVRSFRIYLKRSWIPAFLSLVPSIVLS